MPAQQLRALRARRADEQPDLLVRAVVVAPRVPPRERPPAQPHDLIVVLPAARLAALGRRGRRRWPRRRPPTDGDRMEHAGRPPPRRRRRPPPRRRRRTRGARRRIVAVLDHEDVVVVIVALARTRVHRQLSSRPSTSSGEYSAPPSSSVIADDRQVRERPQVVLALLLRGDRDRVELEQPRAVAGPRGRARRGRRPRARAARRARRAMRVRVVERSSARVEPVERERVAAALLEQLHGDRARALLRGRVELSCSSSRRRQRSLPAAPACASVHST